MSTRFLVRGAFAVALVGGAAACSDKNADVLGPRPSQGNGIFQRYVALGNSITAGYQSGGINDSTQRRSYAALVAAQMGTRYAYASVAMPGCPPPISNFLTQARFTPTGFPTSTSTSCYLRTSTSATDILNNVAVPGATSFDPNAATTAASNVLTTLILGGRTQVQGGRRQADIRNGLDWQQRRSGAGAERHPDITVRCVAGSNAAERISDQL